jgi:hypothetical protein
MKFNKIIYIASALIISFLFVGVSAGTEAWPGEEPTATSFLFNDLTATIHVTVKNNNNHVVYFKMSQEYQGSLLEGENISWVTDWTNPEAVKMVKSKYPALGGDYGWKIQPGETKTVSFKQHAVGAFGDISSYIVNVDADNTTYWPLVNEPGLMASWFMPNELEILNPGLDIKKWTGTFTFTLTNVDSVEASGIVRGPIIPSASKLIDSDPQVTYIDKETAVNTNIAAWDVTMASGASRSFSYTYEWPSSTSGNGSTARAGSKSISTSGENETTIPSQKTGVPYGLFVVGALVAAAGIGYARFMR